MVKEVFVKYLF